MKMMIWNCEGAFAIQQKYKEVPADIDIGVILECEDNGAQKMSKEVKDAWKLQLAKRQAFAKYHYDIPKKNDLGIAAFVYNDKFEIKQEYIIADWLKQFLVFTINDKIRVVVYHGDAHGLNGIGDLRYVIDRYNDILFSDMPLFVCGDFNSNENKDIDNPVHSHSEFEKTMYDYGMESYYKLQYGKLGKKKPTWRQNRNKEGGKENHIDYFFGEAKYFQKNKFSLGERKWWDYSDHIPLTVELDNTLL
ncbi:hypothetical protein [Selenomonas ruminantium]|uniref:endonuclease/exonuclease/phosphatase family protein n=1 Tax=Selenomonas ruminantium TaxID=971 RepID=UPI0026EAC216|nr:hypothetical protein [Selenomonas ruminantium]